MLKDVFTPNKRSLIALIVILVVSSPIFLGMWQGSVTTQDMSWPLWRNIIMFFFFSLSLFGSFFQAPFFFIIRPLGEISNTIIVFGMILNSYIIASLIATLWSQFKKKIIPKKDIIIYTCFWFLSTIGGFIAYFGDFQNLLVFIIIIIFGIYLTINFKKYSKKAFITASILTFIFILGALRQTIGTFEENYCWDTTAGKNWQTHKDCHKNFSLLNALNESFLGQK